MTNFLDENFLLETEASRILYHDHIRDLPIIDYHCHLPPAHIATDLQFSNLSHAWLHGDHYKWRAMRANGVSENYCSGSASDEEKFYKWAETVPYTLRNPLYHWTHLELQRYFNIQELLKTTNAKRIYEDCSALLQTSAYSVKNLLRRMNVRVVCTTDDPTDTLEFHQQLADDNFEIQVRPSFRPDKAMYVDEPTAFNEYVGRLEELTNIAIVRWDDYLGALKARHDFFAAMGCRVADHGLEFINATAYTEFEVNHIFDKLRKGFSADQMEKEKFRSALLYEFARWHHEKGWVQQFHLGAMRNNNRRMFMVTGPDGGWDSIGDYRQASALSSFLNRLDTSDQLAKTIIYNLNPADNAVMASMIGNFNDGSIAGKIQYGSAWWFLDQKDGMISQLNNLSNMGLLSRFIGMLTDSRSFLSFPRHEYFRRILANLFGKEIDRGELPYDLEWTGTMLQNIAYHNANHYFGFGAENK